MTPVVFHHRPEDLPCPKCGRVMREITGYEDDMYMFCCVWCEKIVSIEGDKYVYDEAVKPFGAAYKVEEDG